MKRLVNREYAAYNREFLDGYIPNVTQYLSTGLCEHLYKRGRTDGKRSAGTYARQIFSRLLIELTWNSSRLEGNTYSFYLSITVPFTPNSCLFLIAYLRAFFLNEKNKAFFI